MPAQRLIEIERRWVTLIAQVVNGVPQAATDQTASDEVWQVDVITLTASPAVPTTCALYHGDIAPQNFVIQSMNAALDTFEGQLEIPSSTSLVFAWSGQVGAAALRARLHYVRYRIALLPTDPTLASWRH